MVLSSLDALSPSTSFDGGGTCSSVLWRSLSTVGNCIPSCRGGCGLKCGQIVTGLLSTSIWKLGGISPLQAILSVTRLWNFLVKCVPGHRRQWPCPLCSQTNESIPVVTHALTSTYIRYTSCLPLHSGSTRVASPRQCHQQSPGRRRCDPRNPCPLQSGVKSKNAKVDLHGLKQASNDSTMILEMSWGTWDRSWTNSLDSLGVLLPSFALKSIVTHGLRANLLAITIWWASGIYDTSNHQDRNAWSDDVLPRIRIAAIKVPGSFTAFAKTNLFGTALILGLWRSILPENLGNRYLQATYIKSYRLIRNINIHQYNMYMIIWRYDTICINIERDR